MVKRKQVGPGVIIFNRKRGMVGVVKKVKGDEFAVSWAGRPDFQLLKFSELTVNPQKRWDAISPSDFPVAMSLDGIETRARFRKCEIVRSKTGASWSFEQLVDLLNTGPVTPAHVKASIRRFLPRPDDVFLATAHTSVACHLERPDAESFDVDITPDRANPCILRVRIRSVFARAA